MKIKYCIFDIGSVCYPYTPEPANAYLRQKVTDKEWFDKVGGLRSFDIDPFLKGEIDLTQLCKDLCQHFKITYYKGMEEELSAADHAGLGPFIEVTAGLMKELKAQGIEICLLSNITSDLEDIVPQMVDKDKRFLSYEMGMIKPDIEIYQTVLKKLKAKPEEVLFIDDLEVNVKAAQKLGINAIVFKENTIVKKVRQLLGK